MKESDMLVRALPLMMGVPLNMGAGALLAEWLRGERQLDFYDGLVIGGGASIVLLQVLTIAIYKFVK